MTIKWALEAHFFVLTSVKKRVLYSQLVLVRIIFDFKNLYILEPTFIVLKRLFYINVCSTTRRIMAVV